MVPICNHSHLQVIVILFISSRAHHGKKWNKPWTNKLTQRFWVQGNKHLEKYRKLCSVFDHPRMEGAKFPWIPGPHTQMLLSFGVSNAPVVSNYLCRSPCQRLANPSENSEVLSCANKQGWSLVTLCPLRKIVKGCAPVRYLSWVIILLTRA
jgi:hypothetical protein